MEINHVVASRMRLCHRYLLLQSSPVNLCLSRSIPATQVSSGTEAGGRLKVAGG